ncbi:MAG TPA: protein-methionine-sulfoxide reductase catalytic subunit MsrP [Terriglobales bacterium]|nr:protein-methionine-sulfoxide reductase catalytic subunit MsrP [Terriglobales bacterium]
MLIKKGGEIPSSEITPKETYLNRRSFLTAAAAIAGGAAISGIAGPLLEAGTKINTVKGPFGTDEKQTPYKDITTYNNYYEFGTNKDDPSRNAGSLRTRPWSVSLEGDVKKSRKLDIDDILKLAPAEDRVYRHRCVEAWSMVIPWVGFPLSVLLKQVEPTAKAKFVQFETLADASQMPGVREPILDWPYKEGLRMDEAMHPLTLLTFGLYGETLPNQDGAPIRVVIPWKYGFKSAKSIVKIKFVSDQPSTAWNTQNAHEYGFYSNVNPQVDHPRWSQATERRIGEFFRRKTLMFNGYGDQVASMYNGMDLRKYY